MTLATSSGPDHRVRSLRRLVRLRERGGGWTRSALAVRGLQLVAAVPLFLLLPKQNRLAVLIFLVGLLVAVVVPARNGPALALIGAAWAWIAVAGGHWDPPATRVLPFALALFALHDLTALAAVVPMSSRLRPEAWQQWLRRSLLSLLVAVPLIGCVYLVAASTSGPSTAWLRLAGMIGVLLPVLVGAVLLARQLNDPGDGV